MTSQYLRQAEIMTQAWAKGELWGFPTPVRPYDPQHPSSWKHEREISCTGCGRSIFRTLITKLNLKCFPCKQTHKRTYTQKWQLNLRATRNKQ